MWDAPTPREGGDEWAVPAIEHHRRFPRASCIVGMIGRKCWRRSTPDRCTLAQEAFERFTSILGC